MTPEQLAILAAEVQGDQEGLGYAQWLPDSPGMVVALLNAPTHSMLRPLRTTTAQAWAAAGPMSAIVDASEKAPQGQTDHPCRASCLVLLRAFNSGIDIHVERDDVQAMFAALVATDICTAGERDDLMARAMQPASRAEVLGLPQPTEHDLIHSGVIA